MVNSRLGLFTATTGRSCRTDNHHQWPPFSRSYGVMLPSSLAKVLPFTLAVFCQSTSVGLRYGRTSHSLEAFLGGSGVKPSAVHRSTASQPTSAFRPRGFASQDRLRKPTRVVHYAPRFCPSASPHRYKRNRCGAGILTCCPSTTPFGLALGPTTPGWIILPQEPLDFRWQGFSPCFHATHSGIRSSSPSTCPSGQTSPARRTLPYHSTPSRQVRGFGARLEPRYILGAEPLDQ